MIAAIGSAIGEDGEALVAATSDQAMKNRLRMNTQEAVDRGGYGSPTIFVAGDDMYFGNDQLPLVRGALAY
ncbi:DsbA family protein [Parahaliea mediterranea]